jgi:hypothetical protein
VNLSSFGRRLLQLADAATFYSITNLFSTANTWTAVQTFSANPSMTGGAISFPATQVPSAGANDLDDYEEGTFTPAFSASGSTFSYTGTGAQTAQYTKIGRLVEFDITLILNTSGNTLTANALTITGLPFTATSTGTFPVFWAASTTSYVLMFARLNGTSLTITGLTAAATVATAVLANGGLHATNGSSMRIIGTYTV